MKLSIKHMAWLLVFPLAGVLIGQGCGEFKAGEGFLGSEGGWGDGGGGGSRIFSPSESAGLRMLSVREYDNSVRALLGEEQGIGAKHLPEDSFVPFDNFMDAMSISEVRVRSLESAADEIVQRFLASRARMDQYLPCRPEGATDSECFQSIIEDVGLRAFRRPLSPEESDAFLASALEFADKGGSVESGLEVFLKVVLQHPNYLYRWEMGEAVDGNGTTYKLNDYELASRLAFTLWGAPPDKALLTAVSEGRLQNRDSYMAVVDEMLKDDRAIRQVDFFHSAWLGYQKLGDQSDITRMMRQETRALLKRVIFEENRPWVDVLTSEETYVTPELAEHYGIRSPAGDSGWVSYGSNERRGLFSQGSFLAVGAKFGDTSPIQRGYSIRKNVFCEHIPPPPPGIDVDEPPKGDTSSPCKEDQHHASTLLAGTSCVGCHQMVDTIGFGLERYDALGAFRVTQPGLPECRISGQGEVMGYGSFSGPGELGKVAVESGRVERCLVERWAQLTFGRSSDEGQETIVNRHVEQFQKTGRFTDLVRDFVGSNDFRYRKALTE